MEVGGEHYSNTSMSITSSEEEEGVGEMELKRGPWTVDEDLLLINYIGVHGEGRWNSLSRSAGLRRSGKSCRLRWLNYLRPDVLRGNITLEEQLTILQLHSQWGNRWSKIAQYLPGRTDNEIKNYWRTRVQKHAKQLGCSVNSKLFKDTMRYIWMPRLMEKIQATTSNNNTSSFVASGPQEEETLHVSSSSGDASNNNLSYNTDNSSLVASSDNTQISTVTGLQEYTTPFQFDTPSCNNSSSGSGHYNFSEECLISPNGYFNQNGFGLQGVEQQDNLWLGNDGFWDNLWNVDQDTWFPN